MSLQEGVSINDKILNKILFCRILQKFIDRVSIHGDPLLRLQNPHVVTYYTVNECWDLGGKYISYYVIQSKIQQTKMLVTCQRFGDLFIWTDLAVLF